MTQEAEQRRPVPDSLQPHWMVARYAHGWYAEPNPERPHDPPRWACPPRRVVWDVGGELWKRRRTKIRPRVRRFSVTRDEDLETVIVGCATDREGGTWITEPLTRIYCELGRSGLCRSFEVRQDGRLVGGLFGISIGQAFMVESTFHHVPNAGVVAFYALWELLVEDDFQLCDFQGPSRHLLSIGGVEIGRDEYLRRLRLALWPAPEERNERDRTLDAPRA